MILDYPGFWVSLSARAWVMLDPGEIILWYLKKDHQDGHALRSEVLV